MTKCIRCHKPVNVELTVYQVQTVGRVDPPNGKRYGRFSIRYDCTHCGLRQKKTVKFEGDKSAEKIHKIASETWIQLQKTVKPASQRKFKTLCWVKELEEEE